MTFVKLSLTDGSPVWINLQHVSCMAFDKDRQCTMIYEPGPSGTSWAVRGTPEDVARLASGTVFAHKGFRT